MKVIDSHTGGEPFRVVIDGPAVIGDTMIERRREAARNLEGMRRALMWEPRGHADMYGGFLGPPVEEGSDLSVLFLHNDGFSTMCGHGIIALTRVALETGILTPKEPETTIRIDTPAGTVEATASVNDGEVGGIRFRNVPSFLLQSGATVDVPGLGPVGYDLAFGGAFYAFVEGGKLGLGLERSDIAGLIGAGRLIKRVIGESVEISHPIQPELGFLYGVIFTGPADDPAHHSKNVCVFADGEVDRSPTGTGVSARLAIHHARGELAPDETIVVEGVVGSTFSGRVVETTEVGGAPAVIPEIGGNAYITGRSEFWLDPGDELGEGFLVR